MLNIFYEIIGGFDQSGTYIDIFYAKTCATTKINTVAGYHVVLATLLFSQLIFKKFLVVFFHSPL